MIKGIDTVMLNSENAKELATFYRETVGLTQTDEFEGEEGAAGYAFEFGEGKTSLYVSSHSGVKGKNDEPQRMFINIEVNDAEVEARALKDKRVKVVQDVYHVEGYGLVATFEDPDGNYFQLVQVRASE